MNAATQVWADVGGTFTDCFVTVGGKCTATKVLSSGVVRATVARALAPNQLQLVLPADRQEPGFWTGAAVSRLTADGRLHRLGTVAAFDAANSAIELVGDADSPADSLADSLAGAGELRGAVVQLDPALEAPVLAARLLLGVPLSEALPPLDVRLGTTRGTNALLTRSGAPTALLVTQGFADVLRIGEQDRPELFELAVRKPAPLTERVIEVAERLEASGEVLEELDTASLREQLVEARRGGAESLAICFLHAHVNDRHERMAETLAREVGFTDISRSSEVAPLIKLISRAETTTLDAYLNPILAGYVSRVWKQFGGAASCRLRLMTSGGNLVAPDAFRGRDSILSGPAGGVVALEHVATTAGSRAAIGLDMGGTSTDVSRFEGRVGRRYESRVAGIRVMTPMMDIQTVAAGGGSICDFVDGRLAVGPASAGADPGPACYGRGGPLTVTDVNLLLGRLPESRFPFPLRRNAADERLLEVADRLAGHVDDAPGGEALAEGLLQIAVTHMAEAVRTVSTAEGSDVRQMSLVGFGGAAGQHLCRVAATLGMSHIVDHPAAGMLSALGMGLANVGRVVTRGVYRPLDAAALAEAERLADELRDEAQRQLEPEHDGSAEPVIRHECDLRYVGTESSLPLPLWPIETLGERFAEKHQQTFGYQRPDRPLELVAVRCEAVLPLGEVAAPEMAERAGDESTQSLWYRGEWLAARLIDRAALTVGETVAAPALVASDHGTLVIEPGWQGRVGAEGVIELSPVADASESHRESVAEDDPVMVEVIARRLAGIAEAMGEVIRRTSVSVNVKERRDYSCAVFRSDGSLIANAPHVPVHLGAMGHTVRRMMEVFGTMSPGDCYVSNNPFAGGSHLPDVTVVTPVFCDAPADAPADAPPAAPPAATERAGDSPRPDFFVASRAHHAEIGGRTPGSMPPEARSLAEEGVVISDFALVRGGESREDELRTLLSSGRYPSRNVEENLADIAAQQAAAVEGTRRLKELAATYSPRRVETLMGQLLAVAGDSVARWVAGLPEHALRFSDALDDGTPIVVRLQRQSNGLLIDFEGTGGVHPLGFNATPAIVTAAVLYVLRAASGSDLPLCDGVLRDVELRIPSGLLNPPAFDSPERCAAVVAGNVETSQRIVDVLLGALGVAAASQGTMNNVLIGDESFGYYETIGGGSGATPEADGADAVHTHMTNTRITDAEVLESRLPVRLWRFAIRRGSGGEGQHRGGCGIVREMEFLRPLVVSLITGRRTIPPYGAAGGAPARPGENWLIRQGEATKLPPTVTTSVAAGERLLIKTPGGGGWGG